MVRSVLLIVAVWTVAMASLWVLADRARTDTATAASIDLFRTVLASEQQRMVQIARDYAWWDDSIRNVLIALDPEWADNNLGGYLNEAFSTTLSVVLRSDGLPLYGAQDGARMEPPSTAALGRGTQALLAAARAAPRAPLPAGAAGIILLDGRPAVAAAMPFVPEEADSPQAPDPETVLLVARVLDEPWLAELGGAFRLQGLRLAPVDEAARAPAAAMLETLDGVPLAAAAWWPAIPGDRLDGAVLGTMGALSLAMLAVLVAFLNRARRLAHRVAADDAERLAQADALVESRSRLRLVVASAPVALVVVDADGAVVLAEGREAPHLRAAGAGSPIGLPLAEAYRHLAGFPAVVSQALAGQAATATVWSEHRAFEAACAPVPDHGGAVAVLTDITERKTAEETLRRTLDELTRSNAELERFAYIASHDLQEPVRTMVAYAQLTRRRYAEALDTDGRDFLGFIEGGALRMRDLVQGLLAYSRLNGQLPTDGACDGGEALAMALDNLADAIRESGAEVSAGPMPRLAVDALELTQVFQNLIGNALKFRHPHRRPRIDIAAQTARLGGHWTITVRDDGIGISEEYLDDVFILFKRLHGPGTFDGTGVGLAICQRIVERHGGRIWVTSQAGEGSAFHFILPEAAPEASDTPQAPAAASDASEAGAVRAGGAGKAGGGGPRPAMTAAAVHQRGAAHHDGAIPEKSARV